MNIIYIWDGDYPWDVRAEKVCNSLQKNSHLVAIVCRNQKRRATFESCGGIEVYRLPYLPRWLGSTNNFISFPAFFNPFWLLRIFHVARITHCECIIVRDLPMALAGLVIARMLKAPCILDMAECYPEMLRCAWKFEGVNFKNIIIRNPWIADLVEKLVIKCISHIWVMIEESRDRLLRMGVDQQKISIVSNTPAKNKFFCEKASNINTHVYRMIYVGLLNPSRGLDTVLNAISLYIQKNSCFHFLIAGTGKAEKALKLMVDELNIGNFVTFLGWVNNEYIPELMASADVGIVPHHNCGHWANTIPNKLFDYMASGKPVIVSDVAPMKRLVNDIGCGRVYKDYDLEDLCRVIDELSDPSLRQCLAAKGVNAISQNYHWEREEKTMLESLCKVFEQR